MIFFWIIMGIRKLVWLIRLPKPEDVAKANLNERCPVCGWESGTVRCVLSQKEGPTNPSVAPDRMILRQHTCNICGAGWFHKAIAKDVKPSTVTPSVARTEFEKKADSRVLLLSQETPNA
jgi:hypothetical protein